MLPLQIKKILVFFTFFLTSSWAVASEAQGQVDGEALDQHGAKHCNKQHTRSPDGKRNDWHWKRTQIQRLN